MLKDFSENYFKVLNQFAEGLRECSKVLDSDCWIKPAYQKSVEKGHPPTLEHSVYWMIGGLTSLAKDIEDKAFQMRADTFDPLEAYHNNFTKQS